MPTGMGKAGTGIKAALQTDITRRGEAAASTDAERRSRPMNRIPPAGAKRRAVADAPRLPPPAIDAEESEPRNPVWCASPARQSEGLAMHNALVVGGGGMLGQKLAARLDRDGLRNKGDVQATLADLRFPAEGAPAHACLDGDFGDSAFVSRLLSNRPDPVFLLAAIVSGDAERNYQRGWSVNLQANWRFLEALRELQETSDMPYRPRVVFASTIAVFGPPFPQRIGDEFLAAPQTSYGAQKACAELMLGDASRKGYIDGIALRLPTLCVRPGKPNLAASSFFSGIIREPLNGREAILPVPDSVRHWHASPSAAAGFLRHAATLDTERLGARRSLNMPGVSCTVEEQVNALRHAAGSDAVRRIRRSPDEEIMRIVGSWPQDFDPARAASLGFVAETSFDQIIRTYIAEDLPGTTS